MKGYHISALYSTASVAADSALGVAVGSGSEGDTWPCKRLEEKGENEGK